MHTPYPRAFGERSSLRAPLRSFVVIFVAIDDGLDFSAPPLVPAKRGYLSSFLRLSCDELIHVGAPGRKIRDHGV